LLSMTDAQKKAKKKPPYAASLEKGRSQLLLRT